MLCRFLQDGHDACEAACIRSRQYVIQDNELALLLRQDAGERKPCCKMELFQLATRYALEADCRPRKLGNHAARLERFAELDSTQTRAGDTVEDPCCHRLNGGRDGRCYLGSTLRDHVVQELDAGTVQLFSTKFTSYPCQFFLRDGKG